MPARRAAREMSDSESSDREEETEEEEEEVLMRCLSCQEEYNGDDAGTCKECYNEAKETEEELKSQIRDLKSKVAFLSLPSPAINPSASSPTDLLLRAAEDSAARTIPAHKAVLVSRSPVFKAMLENDMRESRSGIIKFGDISYDTLRGFVNYLYTADAGPDLDNQMAYDLLILGDRYQVKHLKSYSEKFLIAKMSWDKAIANYAFANQYNCKHLLNAALGMIMDNMSKLTKNEYYPDLVHHNPRLVVEIYESYLIKQINTAGNVLKF